MKNGKKTNTGTRSITMAVMTGSTVSIIISMLLAAVTSILMLGETLDQMQTGFVSYTIMFLSVFVGVVSSARYIQTHLAIVSIAVASIYLFVLIAINIIFYDGLFGRVWIGVLVTMASAVSSVLLSVKGRKGKRRQYMRRH